MMKKYIPLLFSIFAISFGFAQDYKITFGYDSAGNQILRDRVCLTCKTSQPKTVVDSTVAIAETSKELENNLFHEDSNITAYPNPITDILQVEWTPTENKVEQIMLFTLDNRQLFNKKVNHQSNGLDIDFNRYPSGVYIVFVLYSDNSKQSFKVIKK